jgi:DNA-directed RNA polymerase beta' subunit
MGLNPEHARPNWAIIKNLAVAPPPVRPSVSLGGNMRSEDDLTYGYQQVLKINNILKEQVEKGANMTIINELKQSLQYYVSTLMDNKIAGQPV